MKTYIIDYGFDEYWVTDKDPDGGDISGNKDITLPVEVVLKSEYDKVREALENCECTCTYYENEFEQCGRCKVLQNK